MVGVGPLVCAVLSFARGAQADASIAATATESTENANLIRMSRSVSASGASLERKP